MRATRQEFRGLVSPHTLGTPRGRIVYWTVLAVVVVTFTATFVFPLYWMVTGAMKSPEELAQVPPTFFPTHLDLGVWAEAWDQLELGTFLLNTLVYAGGAWLLTSRWTCRRRTRCRSCGRCSAGRCSA